MGDDDREGALVSVSFNLTSMRHFKRRLGLGGARDDEDEWVHEPRSDRVPERANGCTRACLTLLLLDRDGANLVFGCFKITILKRR